MDKFTDVSFVGGVFAILAFACIILLQVIKALIAAVEDKSKSKNSSF